MKNKLIWVDDVQIYLSYYDNVLDVFLKPHGIYMDFLFVYEQLNDPNDFETFIYTLTTNYANMRVEYELVQQQLESDDLSPRDENLVFDIASHQIEEIKLKIWEVYQEWMKAK